MNEEWFDELTNGEPLLCSTIQMGIIESLLRISPISEEEKGKIYNELEFYSEEEAEKKLEQWEGNYMNVIKEYLDPNLFGIYI